MTPVTPALVMRMSTWREMSPAATMRRRPGTARRVRAVSVEFVTGHLRSARRAAGAVRGGRRHRRRSRRPARGCTCRAWPSAARGGWRRARRG
ncbi:hypothetical protein FNH09_40490 [Streptomyces adustus]|uniref:Uncharacterized protein n=1 Tax=Streptomyces adustus TaxID=1609272 RepID=A0A5N8VTK0_9ACTN|nr:hypothetical protein [Streptomyces adustus]